MSGADYQYSFMIFRDIYPFVNTLRQREIIDYYLERGFRLSSWELPRIFDAAVGGAFSPEYLVTVLDRLRAVARVAIKRYSERQEFEKKLDLARNHL